MPNPRLLAYAIVKTARRVSGAAFATVVALPQPALNVQGDLKSFSDRGDSGQSLYRRFCPECGSPVMDEAEAMPGRRHDSDRHARRFELGQAEMEIFCDSAQPWVKLEGEHQRFPKMPTRG